MSASLGSPQGQQYRKHLQETPPKKTNPKQKQNKASKNLSTLFGRRRFLKMFTYLILLSLLYYIFMWSLSSSSLHIDLQMMCLPYSWIHCREMAKRACFKKIHCVHVHLYATNTIFTLNLSLWKNLLKSGSECFF